MFSCLSPIKRTPLQRQVFLLLKAGEYEIAIGATYKTALRVSDRTLRVTGGKMHSIN